MTDQEIASRSSTSNNNNMKSVTVIGGGLVGSMMSCFLANQGFQVALYEMREDPRIHSDSYTGKSINLAISERGRSALRSLGIEEEIIKNHAIAMNARLIHDRDGVKRIIPYGQIGQSIYSVSRRFLNQRLLDLASSHDNVNIFFHHKTLMVDFERNQVDFVVRQGPENKPGDQEEEADKRVSLPSPFNGYPQRKTINSDIIIGCDGAYSCVRKSLMKVTRMNFSQEYIDHGYLELTIPPTQDTQDFAMEVNFLHIWPRDEFMMIALPNQDKSFTVTLFMPFDVFESIKSHAELLSFFERNFPDSLDVIGRENLCKDFFGNKPSSLVSIKCSPIHFQGKGLIIGDAAHAMVPFFGQGMNCGFEDCLILNDIMSSVSQEAIHGAAESNGNVIKQRMSRTSSPGLDIMENIFVRFEQTRNQDHHVICDLAMYNYIEMRHLVNSMSFLVRKKVDHCLNRFFPSSWQSLYQMVTFSRIPYSQCLSRKQKQDWILRVTSLLGTGFLAVTLASVFLSQRRRGMFIPSILLGPNFLSLLPFTRFYHSLPK